MGSTFYHEGSECVWYQFYVFEGLNILLYHDDIVEDYYDDPNDVCYDLVDDEVDDSDFTETIPSDDEAEPIDEPLYDTVFC